MYIEAKYAVDFFIKIKGEVAARDDHNQSSIDAIVRQLKRSNEGPSQLLVPAADSFCNGKDVAEDLATRHLIPNPESIYCRGSRSQFS